MTPPGSAHLEPPARVLEPILGWREWLALPDFGIACIQALIDPSVRLSELHAEDVRYEEIDGCAGVRFGLRPIRGDDRTLVAAAAPLAASGRSAADSVPVIRAHVTLGAQTWPVDFSLVPHDLDGYRMRLGREAFHRRFTVNKAASFVAGPPTVFLPGLL